MARYKHIDTSPCFIPVDLERQLVPGTFEHALNYLVDQELDLRRFDARCQELGYDAFRLEAVAQHRASGQLDTWLEGLAEQISANDPEYLRYFRK